MSNKAPTSNLQLRRQTLDNRGNSFQLRRHTRTSREGDNSVANTRAHRASHEYFNMKEQPDHADSGLTETMAARMEIKELGDPARHKEITDAVEALDGVIEVKIEKGALHVSFDPLGTSEKKIENAIRSTGNTINAAATDRETPHPELPRPANVEQPAVEKARRGEHS